MAPTTFRLIVLQNPEAGASFITAIQTLSSSEKPLYVGKCQHWIHSPHLSSEALLGDGCIVQRWDYLIVHRSSSDGPVALPSTLAEHVGKEWSITAIVDDEQLDNLAEAKRSIAAAELPRLPSGWSPEDHSGLDAAAIPEDLELHLAVTSYPLGADKSTSTPVPLKDFVRTFGTSHSGPVDMFNLLSYLPNGREQYFKYIAAFIESVGSRFGGAPIFAGLGGIVDWSSKASEHLEEGVGWQDTAIVHYPSIWHFAKMLDDPAYVDVDRRFKQGALRDNPLICCVEVEFA